MDVKIVYQLLKEEILELRKCQFQMYTFAAGVTSAALVFADKTGLGGLAFLAPMLFNAAALMMVVLKEQSIFRKVSYLQLVEQNPDARQWRWETDLDAYRSDTGTYPPFKKSRNHTYPLLLSAFVNLLNGVSLALYFFSPYGGDSGKLIAPRIQGVFDTFAVALPVCALVYTAYQFKQLISGKNCTAAMVAKWRKVLGLTTPSTGPA